MHCLLHAADNAAPIEFARLGMMSSGCSSLSIGKTWSTRWTD
jgi:hypothetical protein